MGMARWQAMLIAVSVASAMALLIVPFCLAHPWAISNPQRDAPYGFPFQQRGPILMTSLLVDLAGACVFTVGLGLYFYLTGFPKVIRYRPKRGMRRPPTG